MWFAACNYALHVATSVDGFTAFIRADAPQISRNEAMAHIAGSRIVRRIFGLYEFANCREQSLSGGGADLAVR